MFFSHKSLVVSRKYGWVVCSCASVHFFLPEH